MEHSPEFLELASDARSRVKEVTVAQTLERMKEGVRLIDVREDNEWEKGHAKGAEHLGRGVIERDIRNRVTDKHEEIILYCGGGFRSALAADHLQRMGYDNVLSMSGGWSAWKEANAPVDMPTLE